jgi:tyrosyl-tRNA synthetase
MNKEIDELLTRGVAEVIGADVLKKNLLSGKKLRIKLGIDPTSPDIHIGRAVSLLKLRDFQRLGHTPVLIVGDFTSIIGDTSDKDSERPMLDPKTIKENQKTYFEQIGKIIDLNKAELKYNSSWLEILNYREIAEQANFFSLSDFIARDNIARRLNAGKKVSLREVLYPLMQGYDSFAVQADVELGGTDQRFNLLAGRTIQEKYGQVPQSIVMNPLIEGLDGRKMSSSWGNVISLTQEPSDMYGKIMSMADAQVENYFNLCTRVPVEEIKEILSGHPKEAKMRLAKEIATLYHGAKLAEKAEEDFTNTFSKGGVPEDIKIIKAENGATLANLLVESEIVSSKSEWRRLVEQGAVHEVDGENITDVNAVLEHSLSLRIGKHQFVKIVLE